MPVIVAVRGSVLSAPSPLLRYDPEPLPRPERFAAFVRDERAPLCAFLRARGASADDAEDIAQDCMERLIRYQSHGSEELRLLLYRIARNRLADRGRSPHARTHLPLADGDGAAEPLCTAPGPLRQAESGQMLSLLRQALFKLPERCREVYLLNRISGMSYAQIARHRGITAKTVEKHIARALQGLRQELGPDTFGQDGDT
ncbi:RNA polymerase sigma factor [Stenotrophomonas sp. NPDC077421]|jgi:RNA polymerase sigma-70 factor (ECF subfamily)|uniref:RNA polymerase sigma factor n=1 Tax=Stenotrophomonas TaxID=40323 RepID=UPI0013103888|nr:putative RNA polymerase sigma factor [Stenotrophomonas rhizophila]